MTGYDDQLQKTLENALAQLGDATGKQNPQALIATAIESLKTARVTNNSVYERLADLGKYIANAKQEIANIRADAISGEHIPSATDQLDEVVGATEEATNKIMDCCDAINLIAGKQPQPTQQELTDQVTKIYEACNFQDLTGQRITKVVRTLKHIDTQVTLLLKALDDAGFQIEKSGVLQGLNVSKATDTEKHLLNGPQAADAAIKQDDIDKLFG
ncbi:MAG: protein phosphatase CheZ [Alphaproteobacteria bacterium]|nr:protein phosphatase CheZ [Alphaproteobacteria bacterium]